MPDNLVQALDEYTREGYRVIAIAGKQLGCDFDTLECMERDKLESDLDFLGLMIMENRLKPETRKVIDLLNDANIRTLMCTGDSLLTGLCVAHSSGFIKEGERIIQVCANGIQHRQPKFKYSRIFRQKVENICKDYQVKL